MVYLTGFNIWLQSCIILLAISHLTRVPANADKSHSGVCSINTSSRQVTLPLLQFQLSHSILLSSWLLTFNLVMNM
ncbi:hypothetical protein EV424DRAFT_1380509, partial [Suillus variegatus]